MHKLAVGFAILATPVVPPPVRELIHTYPLYYALIAVGFALLGGFAVQYRSWVHGGITVAQASSELMFSAIAGLVAYWVAARQQLDPIDLFGAAMCLGIAGRPTLMAFQAIVQSSALSAARRALGVSDERRHETPAAEASQAESSGSAIRPVHPDPGGRSGGDIQPPPNTAQQPPSPDD